MEVEADTEAEEEQALVVEEVVVVEEEEVELGIVQGL